jgi:hypothetical protein
MLNDFQHNHIATQATPIILDSDILAIDEITVSNEQPVMRPTRRKRRPILEARGRRHVRLNGRH